ncbi:hypothetical protein ANN_23242 [Periplaneta americana]|uniref:BESS domain-containing protein n=1 Tax=Periplaneta americana TaxID=6978 RepID=A0ABQ8SLF7_PERAM|nr:hypothetical protein ANN_23242 [Periplaneta americana]
MKGNVPNTEHLSFVEEWSPEFEQLNSTTVNENPGNSQVAAEMTKKRKRITSTSPGESGIDRLYLKQLERIISRRKDDDDPDLLFLRSLIPMMKKLGPIENLEFKGEVIQLLKTKLQSSNMNYYDAVSRPSSFLM